MNSRTHPTDRDKGNGVELTTEEARAGATPHMTRYILGWGLALVIIAFLIVLAAYSWG
ncbi:hypothetical protein [Rhizorhabdus histidinilytica]|jgi:hypothetical protein|uniref:Uncharacterized protein n=1 Tax=Rhizorhabdus histidinilytica TaxID=439228 RepID=A0A1T5CIA8_9SPHN|nr:hypothetical protein [Rhizorhabdus histidinilytica]SKB59198.1 hypothetical protein SAMN06295920_10487 [Rhizorhabdus histidinilytica]